MQRSFQGFHSLGWDQGLIAVALAGGRLRAKAAQATPMPPSAGDCSLQKGLDGMCQRSIMKDEMTCLLLVVSEVDINCEADRQTDRQTARMDRHGHTRAASQLDMYYSVFACNFVNVSPAALCRAGCSHGEPAIASRILDVIFGKRHTNNSTSSYE